MEIPAQLTLANFVTNVFFNRGSVNNIRICSYSSFLPGISDFLNFDPVYNFSQVNGQLVVQREGVYHVFAQVFFENYPDAPSIYHNRVELTINEKPIAVMQTPIGNQADYGSESSGAVLRLKKGDLIGLKTVYRSSIWLTKHHTFFGAHSINF